MQPITPVEEEALQRVVTNLIHFIWFHIEFTDELLTELVSFQVITENERYSIFASPSPTVFRNSSRVARFRNILRYNFRILQFIDFLKEKSHSKRNFREVFNLFQTEISNVEILRRFLSD
jgi:hypothetical protein